MFGTTNDNGHGHPDAYTYCYPDPNAYGCCDIYIDPKLYDYPKAKRDADEHRKAIANSHADGLASVRRPERHLRQLPAGVGWHDVACAPRPARRWGGARADR